MCSSPHKAKRLPTTPDFPRRTLSPSFRGNGPHCSIEKKTAYLPRKRREQRKKPWKKEIKLPIKCRLFEQLLIKRQVNMGAWFRYRPHSAAFDTHGGQSKTGVHLA